jgi:tetratricopeptide (TPR) repeat protein
MGGSRYRWSLRIAAIIVVLVGVTWLIIRNVPENPGVKLRRGVSAYGRKDWRAAEDQARSILKNKPSDFQALRLLARSAARQGRVESAEAIYRRLGTSHMEAEDLFLLGRGLLGRGQVGPALASLGAARDEQPDHAETLDALSHYWAETRSMTDAADAAERLRKQPGWEVTGSVRLARLRSELFDPAGAADLLTEALSRDPKLARADLDPAAARRLLARCLLQAGRPAEARTQLQDSSGRELDPEGAWLLSRTFLQEGKVAEATSALAAARGFGSSDPMRREPAPYRGAARCESCHVAEYRSQQQSRHARTLRRTADLGGLPWPKEIVPDTDNPRVEHRFRRIEDRIDVETQVDNQAFTALVKFAMGSNHHGQSFLAREEQGQIRELRVSHYPNAPEWSRTMEHPAVPPDPPGYLGRPISSEAVRKCLNCHSTDFRAVQKPEGRPEARDRGIGCERCHGPAGNHQAAIEASFPEVAIARPRLASTAQVVSLCGECHTAPAKTTPDVAGFVRYQVSSLILSRCFIESRESLSCVTCHNPHRDVETSAAFYQSKCLTCHPARATAAAKREAGPQLTWSPCPVNPAGDCLDCHMPRVKDAVPRTVFTDHQIRVHREGVARSGPIPE